MKIKNVSDVVKEIRRVQQEAGLTDEKIAFYGNLSKATVSALLSGKSKEFSLKTVLKIANALDCEVDLSLIKSD